MLIIETMQGKSIKISHDHDYMFTIKKIDSAFGVVVVQLTGKYETKTFFFNKNTSIEILPNVRVRLINISQRQYLEAILGFKAPKSILIRGTWIKKDQTQCKIQLTSLSDKELCIHADQVGKTDLEHELSMRLQCRINTRR